MSHINVAKKKKKKTESQWLSLPFNTWRSVPFNGLMAQTKRKLLFQPFGNEQITSEANLNHLCFHKLNPVVKVFYWLLKRREHNISLFKHDLPEETSDHPASRSHKLQGRWQEPIKALGLKPKATARHTGPPAGQQPSVKAETLSFRGPTRGDHLKNPSPRGHM